MDVLLDLGSIVSSSNIPLDDELVHHTLDPRRPLNFSHLRGLVACPDLDQPFPSDQALVMTPQGLGLLVQPWVLLAIFALLQCASAQFCSFWNNNCIDPLAQTAVSFDFQPLFNDPISLFYSFDSSSSGKGEGPMTKTAFWLGYKDRKVNPYAVDSNRTSEVALRIGNLTGSPGGTTNGCDGIWGKSCSRDIKQALKATIFHLAISGDHYSQPLATALDQLMVSQPDLPSCGAPIFDVASIPVQGM